MAIKRGYGDYNESLPRAKGLFVLGPVCSLTKRILLVLLKERGESVLCWLCIATWVLCVFGTGASKRVATKTKGRVSTSAWWYRGLNWRGLLAWRQCMLGRLCPTGTEAAWSRISISVGPQEEEERETWSEAEGKIETDFLAGVEIMVEQMM